MPDLLDRTAKQKTAFDPEGTGYDDATAKKYGYKPTLGADGKMHMQSRSPETGLLLKGRKHKTWDLLVKGEEEAGYEIYKGEDGRYYSRPKKKGDILDQIDKQRDLLDVIAVRPYDPGEPPLLPPRKEAKQLIKREITDSVLGLFRKGAWAGLGIVAWPFQRIEWTLATPLTKVLEERKKTLAEEGIDRGFGIIQPRLLRSEDAWRESREVINTLGLIGKAWIPGKKPPEGLKTFNDFFGSYYESLTGEPAAEWYKTIAGTGTSILVVPYLFGKMLKGIMAGAKATGIPQTIAARRLPAWQQMKKLARLETGARITDAKDLGRSLGNKEIRHLANLLSKKTGRTITPRAVKLRLTQIIKGGVTTQPDLAAKANPVIEEFARMSKELKRLGILPKYTYISKLPRKEVANLLKQKAQLQKQLAGLQKVPYQDTLRKTAETLRVKGKIPLANRVLRLAESAERGDVKYLKQLSKLLDVNETQLAKIRIKGRGAVIQKLWKIMSDMNRKDPQLLNNLEKVLDIKTTQPGRLRRLLNTFEKARQTERTKILNSIGKAADNLLDVDVVGINADKLGPYAEKLLRLREVEGSRIIDELLTIGGKIEGLELAGLKPLLKKIGSMQRQFPGKAKKLGELSEKITKINVSLQQQYHLGAEQYFPRMYLSKEEQAARGFPLFAERRVRAKFAKQRKRIPEEVRKAMGEIKEPAYPVMKRMIQESSAIETAKLFEFAAGNPKWVSNKWLPGFVKEALPDTKAYGALRGKFVHPTIQRDVTALLRTKSDVEALYDTGMGMWKIGKTVWSPPLHFRNMFSNSVLLDLSGMDAIQQVKYIGKALKHIKQNSEEYRQARRYFMRTTMVRGELLDDMLKGFKEVEGQGLRNVINGINKGVSKISAKPSEIYQAEEFTAKFLKYLEQREKGKSVIEAVQEANKWLFDYSDLANWEKNIARRIMPFYTFPRKALPRILEAAANRPLVLAKYPMLAKSLTQYSLHKLELTTKDYEQIEKLLPEYMSQGSYVLMPYRDANGDLRFFDWTWNVPWGGLFEAEQRGLMKSTVTNPLVQITYEIMLNKSSWTGRKIYDDAIPVDKQTPAYRREQNFKKMLYVWQALSPSIAYKGIYWDKLYGAATGKKVRGKDMLLPEAIAHTIFGVRTQALDVDEARRWSLLRAAKGFDELRGNMVRILMQKANGDITEKEFDKKWIIYTDQLQKFHLDAITEEEDAPTIEELLGVVEELMENPEKFEERESK